MRSVPMSNWVAAQRDDAACRLRLFCIPYAGAGGYSVFKRWIELAPPEIDVCPIELPGRWPRRAEAPFKRMADLIEALVDGIGPLLSHRFALFGYSLGGLVAFELARRWREIAGVEPCRLFVAARSAPQCPRATPTPDPNLPTDALVGEIERCYGGLPPVVRSDPVLVEIFIDMLRADLEILRGYRYTQGDALSCPIHAYGGENDRLTPMSGLEAWREHTAGHFEVRVFAGHHFFIQSQEEAVIGEVMKKLM